MTTSEHRSLTSNKHLLWMVVFGIAALSSYSFLVIATTIHNNEHQNQTDSKLDQILQDANSSDIVVFVVPNNSVINGTLVK